MEKSEFSRRRFLRASLLGTIAAPIAGAGSGLLAGEAPAGPAPAAEVVNGMPYRPLGKTGARVSLLGVGGHNIGSIASTDDAIRVIRTALDEGINFLDNAWEYHQGKSEERMGLALADGYRAKAFLMTKVCGRDEKTAREHLEDSLRRLKTDVIDLWQFHEINYDNDPDLVFAREGAIHAALKAREQGKVRFIGFTGHKSPHIHRKMLERDFPWDAVQMPLNVLDAHYRSFAREVVPVLVERRIGIIGMKSAAAGAIIRGAGVAPADCLRYAFNLPVSVVVSGMDSVEMARQNIATAKAFKPLAGEELAALLDRVRGVAGDGRFERFKSTQDFDSRTHRAQHQLL